MKSEFVLRIITSVFAACFIIGVTAIVVLAGNDFVVGYLRVDLSEVYNARDYRVLLNADNQPSGGYPDFTNGWFGVDLANGNGPSPYPDQFTQVGLVTKSDGIHWFVYAEPGVTCLRGNQTYGTLGCEGVSGDLVSLSTWHWVELVSYGQGYWIARVYESNEVAHDVARISSTSNRIYTATSTTEEGYTVSQDPYLTASFHHWHPQYMTTNGFQDWPQSEPGHFSEIYTTDLNGQNTFCPQYYGANPVEWGDERAWFAGTGGQQCNWPLFPPYHAYLPLILDNY
jgi:hypothetical protein